MFTMIVIKNFLNPEGHQNPIRGSKVMAILMKGWILRIGGASAGEGLPCSLRSWLVSVVLQFLRGCCIAQQVLAVTSVSYLTINAAHPV